MLVTPSIPRNKDIGAGKKFPSKEIPLSTVDPLKETKKILGHKNDKQVRTSTGGPLKKKEITRDKKGKMGKYLR